MTTGADWSQQLFAALAAFAFGLAAAFPLLLLKLGIRGTEKILADFFAVTGSAALFILSAEFGAKGQITPYCIVCFAVGAFAGYRLFSEKIAHALRRLRERTLKIKAERAARKNPDKKMPSATEGK